MNETVNQILDNLIADQTVEDLADWVDFLEYNEWERNVRADYRVTLLREETEQIVDNINGYVNFSKALSA